MGGLWPILTRSLRARPLRAVLTALAVALGVAAVLGVQLALGALDRQAGDVAGQRAGRSDLDVRAVAGRGLFDVDVLQLTRVAGVAEVQPLYQKRVAAKSVPGDTGDVTVTLVGVSPAGEAALRPVVMVRGTLPRPAQGSHHEVTLDQGVVDALAALSGHTLDVGGTVYLTTSTGPDAFTISGISAGTTGGAAFTRSAAFVTDDDAAGTFALGIHVPLAALRLAPGATATQVADTVRTQLGPVVATADPRAGIDEPLQQLRPLLALVVVLSVVIGAGVTANSIAVSAVERRRDVGLLRAAGASRSQVLRLFLGEALLIALAGAILGLVAGFALGLLLVHRFAAADLPTPDLSPGPLVLVGALAAGVGAALAGGLVPALGATRVTALGALRAAPGEREHLTRRLIAVSAAFAVATAVLFGIGRAESVAAGVALALVAVALLLPVLGPLLTRGLGALLAPILTSAPVAAASLGHRRNRTGLVLGVLTISVATAVSLSALTAGALNAGDQWVAHLFAGDAVMVSPATARDAVATEIATRGDVAVGRLRFLSAPVDGFVVGITAADVQPFQDHGGLDIVEGDRATALDRISREAAALVPQQLADRYGWHLGNTLRVDTGDPGGPVAVTVAGVVAHTFPGGDGREGLILGHDEAVTLFGTSAAGFDDLQLVDASSRAGDLGALASSYGMQVTTVADIQAAARRALDHTLQLLTALSWLGVAIAMLAVVNTLVVNVRQSSRELALLRAVGMSRAGTLRLVLLEAALLALAGALVGVLAGCGLAVPLLHASASSGFDPRFALPLATIAAAAAAVIAGSVLAAVIPARRAARGSIVGAIRHE
jgi:putative ABC transport system permease protein